MFQGYQDFRLGLCFQVLLNYQGFPHFQTPLLHRVTLGYQLVQ